MRKFLLLLLLSLTLIAQTAQGDTIHLKNGSVLKGKVASFADDQFIIMLDTGSGRSLSKATVYMGDVARIDFDATASASDSSAASVPTADPAPRFSTTEAPVRETSRETPRESLRETKTRNTSPPADTSQHTTQPVENPPREVGPPEAQPVPVTSQPEKPATSSPAPGSNPPASDSSDSERVSRKFVAVKTMNVDVVAKKDWTSSGLIVKRGDHLRVTASGTITLDPATGRTSGPDGVSDIGDPKKLMPDHPTGALIGVISSDNDDFIFIGRSTEFTAMRDGLLFLSVNEGVLADNLGTFKAVVEVLSPRKQ